MVSRKAAPSRPAPSRTASVVPARRATFPRKPLGSRVAVIPPPPQDSTQTKMKKSFSPLDAPPSKTEHATGRASDKAPPRQSIPRDNGPGGKGGAVGAGDACRHPSGVCGAGRVEGGKAARAFPAAITYRVTYGGTQFVGTSRAGLVWRVVRLAVTESWSALFEALDREEKAGRGGWR